MKYSEYYISEMPEIRKLIENPDDADGLTAFGTRRPSDKAISALKEEILKLTAGNHKVSLVMADLETRSGVAYHSGDPMCTQSAIKGVYIGALLDDRPQALELHRELMRDAIVYSANKPYEQLREIYGRKPLEKWCQETGVDVSFAVPNYPRDKTARDMFRLWTRLYCFLNGPAKDSEVAEWFSNSIVSATREQLGNRFPVHTKAGWENGLDENENYDPNAVIPEQYRDGDPLNDECAINDTGIVYTDKGPYIFVIYTDHPFGIFKNYTTPNPLYNLVEALYQVQRSYA